MFGFCVFGFCVFVFVFGVLFIIECFISTPEKFYTINKLHIIQLVSRLVSVIVSELGIVSNNNSRIIKQTSVNMQNKRIKNILVGLLVLGLALLAVLGPQYLPKFTKLHNVFDDTINIGLIAVLVVLISLFDIKIGVAFAFLVLMFAVYLMDNKNTQRIENFFADVATVSGIVKKPGQNVTSTQEFAAPRMASIKLSPITDTITDLGLLVSSLTPPSDTNYLKKSAQFKEPFTTEPTQNQSTQIEENNLDTINKTNNIALNNTLDTPPNTPPNTSPNTPPNTSNKLHMSTINHNVPACNSQQQYDFLTQQIPNDQNNNINRYDVAGTRYNLQSRPQNLTIYGPPLSWCATYDKQQATKCGTYFYPLNG